MTRLLTLVALSLAMAVAPAFGEAGAKRIHVTAKIVEQTFTGDLADPQIGDQLIVSVELFDEHDKIVGERGYFDSALLLRQLGLLPQAG